MPTLQALADAFHVNKTIEKVDLSYNRIGKEGVKARAQSRGLILFLEGVCGSECIFIEKVLQ